MGVAIQIALLVIVIFCFIWWVFAQAIYYRSESYCIDPCPASYHISQLIFIIEFYVLISMFIVIKTIELVKRRLDTIKKANDKEASPEEKEKLK